jgi:acyl transferase domain-containing protein
MSTTSTKHAHGPYDGMHYGEVVAKARSGVLTERDAIKLLTQGGRITELGARWALRLPRTEHAHGPYGGMSQGEVVAKARSGVLTERDAIKLLTQGGRITALGARLMLGLPARQRCVA